MIIKNNKILIIQVVAAALHDRGRDWDHNRGREHWQAVFSADSCRQSKLRSWMRPSPGCGMDHDRGREHR